MPSIPAPSAASALIRACGQRGASAPDRPIEVCAGGQAVHAMDAAVRPPAAAMRATRSTSTAASAAPLN
jgi:hypothetical protein